MFKYYLAILIMFFFVSCANEQEKIYPEKRTIVESVYASTTVQPDSLYLAYSTVLGILDKNLVEEGDLVHKGDPILQITNTNPTLTKENAKLEYELAKENYSGNTAILIEMMDDIDAAKIQLHNDSINYIRQEKLWDQNIGSQAEYDTRKMTFELSQKKVTSLLSKYERTKNELETRFGQAKNTFQFAMTSTGDYTIRSMISGKVYALYKNKGELVNTMEPVASVGHSDNFILELVVDEVDIVKLSLNQQIFVTLDAYPNQVFNAQLTKIYPQKEERNQTFKVEAKFNEPPSKLYAGLAGEANIVVAEKEDALTIPKEYLLPGNKVQTENEIIVVEVGLENLEFIEIVNGIDENTTILKPEE